MLSCVSDSEDEEYRILDNTVISRRRLERVVRGIAEDDANSELLRLKNKIDSMEEVEGENRGEDQLHKTLNDSINRAREIEESKNANYLKLFLDSDPVSLGATRRGLRKRNFSSTHPYLADQASWLGLADTHHLNDLYKESPDLDVIVKYLNHVYLQKRKRYPKDEKYKAKNFYYYLGKKSVRRETIEAHNDSIKHDSEFHSRDSMSVDEEEQDLRVDTYFSESDSSFEYFVPNGRKGNVVLSDNEETAQQKNIFLRMDSDSSDSSEDKSEDETYIRVGGKFRKERNILRGTLPESAKRLDSFKKKPISKSKSHTERSTPRKGLAIKKQTAKNHRDYIHFSDNNLPPNFIDDSNYYEENTSYLSGLNDDDLELQRVLSIDSVTSEDSSLIDKENESKAESTIRNIAREPEYDASINIENVSDVQITDVLERDYIDRMIPSGGTTNSSKRISTKPKRKVHLSRNNRQSVLAYKTNISSSYPGLRKPVYRRSNPGVMNVSRKTKITKNYRKKRHASGENSNLERNEVLISDKKRFKVNPKEILGGQYQFSRVPNQFTTTLESESEKRFVKSELANRRKQYLQKFSEPTSTLSNGQYDYFTMVDMKKVRQLGLGDRLRSEEDSMTIYLFGRSYVFTLINKSSSEDALEKLMFHLSKVMREEFKLNDYSPGDEIIRAIYGAINWTLIWQEVPNENIWKILRIIIHDLLQVNNQELNEKRFKYISAFLVLFYIFVLLKGRLDQKVNESLELEYGRMCFKYWCHFFVTFKYDDMTLRQDENDGSVNDLSSLELFKCFSFELKKDIWSTVGSAISKLGSVSNIRKLELTFLLVNIKPRDFNQWNPFYTIYEDCILEDNVDVHNFFMEIVYCLHENRSWSLEERQITLVHSTISHRKYANFEDEHEVSGLVGKITTRDDIPVTLLFERFMYFIYYYVSGLTDALSKKRLMNKLFVSSQYSYKDDKVHLAMLVNRLNFILLLKQIGQIDLNNQLYDLFLQIENSKNHKVISLALNALDIYHRLGIERQQQIPLDSYFVLFKSISDNFSIIERAPRLWSHMLQMLRDVYDKGLGLKNSKNESLKSLLQLTAKFDFKELPSLILLDFLTFIDNIISSNFSSMTSHHLNEKILESVSTRMSSLLHFQMGRFPLSVKQEKRTESIIELALNIWVKVTGISVNRNWNILVLQQFPYIGNVESRRYFALYFYSVLLQFSNLEKCIDRVISDLMKSLASLNTSKYVSTLLNTLKECGSDYLPFQKHHMTEKVSSLQVQKFRGTLISDIMFLIATSSQIPQPTKVSHIEDFITQLNAEYIQNFHSTAFSEFCKSSMKTIQLYFKDISVTNGLFRTFASKIGVISPEQNDASWLSLNFHQRLSRVHSEFVSSIYFKKNISQQLDKYLLPDNIDLLYHLIDVYVREILDKKEDRWIVLHYCVLYLLQKLSQFKVKISEVSFRKTLTNLTILISYNDNLSNWTVFINSTKAKVCQIVYDTFYYLDGYKDRRFVTELVDTVTDHQSHGLETSTVSFEFLSDLKLYDLEKSNDNIKLGVLSFHIAKSDMNESNSVQHALLKLKTLLHDKRGTNEVLPFNL